MAKRAAGPPPPKGAVARRRRSKHLTALPAEEALWLALNERRYLEEAPPQPSPYLAVSPAEATIMFHMKAVEMAGTSDAFRRWKRALLTRLMVEEGRTWAEARAIADHTEPPCPILKGTPTR